jgi:hypothetical protein
VKCQSCKGAGAERKASYTRTTTFIDVLEDKGNLLQWHGRKVLQGVATDTSLLDDVLTYSDEEKEGRGWLNRRAEIAMEKAGANKKSEKGTELHELSEARDNGTPIFMLHGTIEDRADIAAYDAATRDVVSIYLMEKLMVNDDLKVAGTPDRVSHPKGELIAPDGTVLTPEDRIITDLKTGRIDYGSLKMAMQLSIYSRSLLYYQSGEREEIPNLRTDWGLIMHLPAGTAQCTIYWADLNAGWDAVLLAREVRNIRKVKPLTAMFAG